MLHNDQLLEASFFISHSMNELCGERSVFCDWAEHGGMLGRTWEIGRGALASFSLQLAGPCGSLGSGLGPNHRDHGRSVNSPLLGACVTHHRDCIQGLTFAPCHAGKA
eukprot:6456785-Amphidinium_carterae.2